MKTLYAALAVPGFLLPMSQLIPFVREKLPLTAFFTHPFVNPVASMFALDLLVSSAVFWILLASDKRVTHRWMYVVMNLIVGLSFALPMFLWARERRASAS